MHDTKWVTAVAASAAAWSSASSAARDLSTPTTTGRVGRAESLDTSRGCRDLTKDGHEHHGGRPSPPRFIHSYHAVVTITVCQSSLTQRNRAPSRVRKTMAKQGFWATLIALVSLACLTWYVYWIAGRSEPDL